MRLKYLKLFNFRQYSGEHLIEFAGIDDRRNVTLIRGANGYGKTGIFRAIMFCLYGDKCLDQDNLPAAKARQGLLLVNEKLLNDNPGQKITAWVELCFTHDGEQGILRREIIACRYPDQDAIQQDGPVQLQVKLASGDTKAPLRDHEKIQAEIDQILPSRLRDFFLFDGERMEKLTRPGEEQRKEIQRGIKTLLQLDTLDWAIEALKKQETKMTMHIQVNSGSDLEAITEKKLKIDQEIINLESDLRETKNNIEIVEHEIARIDTQLNENKQSVELQQKRQQLRDDMETKQSTLAEKVKDLRQVVASFAPALARPAIAELYADLTGRLDRGELPSDVKEEFIDALLQTELCICGTHLAQGSKPRETVDEYKKKKIPPGQNELVKLCGRLGQLHEFAAGRDRQFDETFQSIGVVKEDVQSIERALARIEEELGDSADLDVQQLAQSLQQFKRDKDTYNKKIGALERDILDKEEIGSKLDAKIKELSEKYSRANEFQKRREALQKAITSLRAVSTRYTAVVRTKLEDLATDAFKEMASEETLESISKIIITKDFHLEVENKLGRPMLSQISSGQRQIVSLAYICALIESCGKLEMPLFMDTPLARLSGSNRDGCLKFLPNKTSQWIMLGTDTEIQEEEADALKGSGKLGKVFEISAEAMFRSRIEEMPLGSWHPVRTKGRAGVVL